MPVLNDSLIPPSGPADACSLEIIPLIQMMITGTQISSSTSFDNILIQPNQPGINERGKLWFKNGRLYSFKDSLWVSPIYPPPSSKRRMFWVGSEADLWWEDEGNGNNPAVDKPTAYSGSVWEVDPDFAGRTAIGAGDVPGTSPVVTLVFGQPYGTGALKFLEENMPEHWHWIMRGEQLNSGAPALGPLNTAAFSVGGFGAENFVALGHDNLELKPANVGQTSKWGKKDAEVKPVLNIPPSIAGFWCKRTIRAYYVAA